MSDERFVIARAYGDEPIVMIVIREGALYAEVSRPDHRDVSINFPKSYLYPHSETLLASLLDAWRSSDAAALTSIYRAARNAERPSPCVSSI
jgi:hypothetical protein